MNKYFKYMLIFIFAFLLVSCKSEIEIKDVYYTVTFDADNGFENKTVQVKEGSRVGKPEDPIKDGFEFVYWFLDSNSTSFSFNSYEVKSDITISALWDKLDVVPTTEELIANDLKKIKEDLHINDYLLNLVRRGENGSQVTWDTTSPYLSLTSGLLIPSRDNNEEVTLIVTLKLKGETLIDEIDVVLPKYKNVSLQEIKEVNFTNLTTEYDVDDQKVNLYFEENGNVPYIKVLDFFNLVEGFIDPEVEIAFETTDGVLTIAYDYYSVSQDHLFHLTAIIDSNNHTITTEDPGFYSAYVKTTETNYGRHIVYDYDNENNSYEEGKGLVLELAPYNLEVINLNGDILLPYALVNQIFAGSSYYNVYYNGNGLYGVYSLPNFGSTVYNTIKRSDKSGTDFEYDMFLHTYNMLAFNLDHFYGLKDIKEIDSFYDMLDNNKDRIITLKPSEFDYAVFRMINKDIDELHTSYDGASHYNDRFFEPPVANSVSMLGRRVSSWYNNGVFAMQRSIDAKFPNGLPNYWFLDDDSVVLVLDGFRTLDMQEDNKYNKDYVKEVINVDNIIPEISSGDKFFYINTSTKTNKVLNLLVKNTNKNYELDYIESLLSSGFTKPDSEENYYVKTVDDVEYTVYVSYSEETNVFTVSITDHTYNEEIKLGKSLIKKGEYDYINGDSALYLEIILDQVLAEKPNIKNAVLDVSYNTGGNVGALYRVVGFVTGEPFAVTSLSPDTNSSSTSHVKIDGVPNYEHLNWSVLSSLVSFSAANSLVTIFKENNLGPVIGQTSGGGAASITPILLPNGTTFSMSSNNVSGYRTGSGTEEDPYVYHDNEFGIEPDYSLKTSDIYNSELILNAINAYYNNISNNDVDNPQVPAN